MEPSSSMRFFEAQFQQQVREADLCLNPFERAALHCLFSRDEMHTRFLGWEMLHSEYEDFPAPKSLVKSFVTLIARKPQRRE